MRPTLRARFLERPIIAGVLVFAAQKRENVFLGVVRGGRTIREDDSLAQIRATKIDDRPFANSLRGSPKNGHCGSLNRYAVRRIDAWVFPTYFDDNARRRLQFSTYVSLLTGSRTIDPRMGQGRFEFDD